MGRDLKQPCLGRGAASSVFSRGYVETKGLNLAPRARYRKKMNAVHLVETRQAIDYKYGWVTRRPSFWPQNAIAFSVLEFAIGCLSQPRASGLRIRATRLQVLHRAFVVLNSSRKADAISARRWRASRVVSASTSGEPPPADAFHNRVLDAWRRHRARVAVPFQLLLRPIAHVIAVPSLPAGRVC